MDLDNAVRFIEANKLEKKAGMYLDRVQASPEGRIERCPDQVGGARGRCAVQKLWEKEPWCFPMIL